MILPQAAIAQNAQVFAELELLLRFGADPGAGVGLELAGMVNPAFATTAGVFTRVEAVTTSGLTAVAGGRGGVGLIGLVDCVGYLPIAQAEASLGHAWTREGPATYLGGSVTGLVGEVGLSALARPRLAPPVWSDATASLGFRLPLIPLCVAGRPLRGETPDGAARALLPDDPGAARWLARGVEEWEAAAAFHRLAAELGALGAPSGLVRAAQRAAGEEEGHARLCLERARVGGASWEAGPDGLPPVRRWRPREGRRSARLRTLWWEGLVDGAGNEGRAALEARARSRAGPAVERDIEARIAREEAGHAALGLRVARWAAAALQAQRAP